MHHISAIERQARSGFGLYLRGKQIAYHRSIDMKVRVNTDTVTETVWKEKSEKKWFSKGAHNLTCKKEKE